MIKRDTNSLALYLHVPFCRARCLYCSFASRPAGPSTQTRYIEGLCAEVESYFKSNPEYTVETVYVGGGTPSTLGNGDIEFLIDKIQQIAPDASEITFEVNPHSDDIQKIPTLVRNCVNRLSIGVQSFIDDELSTAGRLHTAQDTRNFIKACRNFGCSNISFDIIHGLPGQSLDSFKRTLNEAMEYNPEHISLYGLSVESESRLGKLPERQLVSLDLPDGDDQADMYSYAQKTLKGKGYVQYEISNFALPGKECRHNLVYWTSGNYIGFGPGASSYVDGARFRRISNVDKYLLAQVNEKNTIEFMENLSSRRAAAEALVMGLRLSSGINKNVIETKFGVKLTDLVGEALIKYQDQGLLEIDEDNIKLTDRAYFVSNAIFREFIE